MTVTYLPYNDIEDERVRSNFEYIESHGLFDVSPVTGSAWIAPTLLNGWVERAGDPAGYLKDPLGFVHLRGRFDTIGSGQEAFVLPAGYRPGNSDDLYPATAFNATTAVACFADIQSGGGVYLYTAAGTTSASIGGITFLAEN